MDVQLYVYDLSKGLARQFSRQFLGTHIDAVYHTSVVFGGIEYFFGAGVHTAYPGTTHHGAPMEVVSLGTTDLPLELILEYLESLKETYTAESYDLFMHNCNNFSHDFAMFLVGKPIPAHITSLPQTVLNTPFGQMLRPQLDAAMRTVTQAPVPTMPQARKSTVTSSTAQHNLTSPLQSRGSGALAKYPSLAKLDRNPILYTSIPPLEKLIIKLDFHGKDPIVASVNTFIRASLSPTTPKQESPLPDLHGFSSWLAKCQSDLSPDKLFAAYDLLRIALAEPRVSGWFLADGLTTLTALLAQPAAHSNSPFALTLVSLQLTCNLFSSSLARSLFTAGGDDTSSSRVQELRAKLLTQLIELASYHLLLPSPAGFKPAEAVRTHAAAVAVLLNISLVHLNSVGAGSHRLSENQKIEIAAGVIEALDAAESAANGDHRTAQERSKAEEEERSLVKREMAILAYLVAGEEQDQNEVRDLCKAMDAAGIIEKRATAFEGEWWVKDVLKLVS